MVDRKQLSKEFIQKNPNLSATEALNQAKDLNISIRKTEFLKLVREIRKLPEPTKAKREKSIPKKFIKVKPKPAKPVKRKPTIQIKLPVKKPFKKTKFGKIVKRMEKTHGISEKKAIERARALLKIPRTDFGKLNQKDVNIILSESP